MKLRLTLAVVLAALAVAVSASTASAGADRTCVPDFVDGRLMCKVEPEKMDAVLPGIVRSIEWDGWGPGPSSIGFGRLLLPGVCCGTERARVKLERLKVCRKSLWWKRLTVKYGAGFDQVWVREAPLPAPCDQ